MKKKIRKLETSFFSRGGGIRMYKIFQDLNAIKTSLRGEINSEATTRQSWLACCSPHLAALSRGFALAARLRTFVMSATTRLGEYTVLLHLAVKLLEGKLKGVTGINSDLTHRLPARSTITRSSSILSLVAIAAINRLVPPWLERHLSLIATARTRCSIHLARFARTAMPPLTFACSATRWAAAWKVCQPVTPVKFLFAYCK